MDYYGVLGVGKDATKAEIKEAFRKLALKYHPDRHSGSSKSVHDDAVRRFKQVAEAYDVLNDDTKRAKYSNSYSSARSSYNTARASSSSAYYNNHNYNPYSNPNSYYYTKTSTRRHAYTDPRRYTYSAQYSQSVGGFNRLMAMIQLAATFTVFGCYIIADATGRGLWESANRGVVRKAKYLCKFIYGHNILYHLFLRYFAKREIIRPEMARFATNYIFLQSVLKQKVAIMQMFVFAEFTSNLDFASLRYSREGIHCRDRIAYDEHLFWEVVVDVCKATYSTCYTVLTKRSKIVVDDDRRPVFTKKSFEEAMYSLHKSKDSRTRMQNKTDRAGS